MEELHLSPAQRPWVHCRLNASTFLLSGGRGAPGLPYVPSQAVPRSTQRLSLMSISSDTRPPYRSTWRMPAAYAPVPDPLGSRNVHWQISLDPVAGRPGVLAFTP